MTATLQGPAVFFAVLSRVRDDLVAAFQATSSSFGRVAIYPAAIAWDSCDQCGLLALAQTRLYLSEDYPNEAAVSNSMQAPYLISDCVVQAIRCAPVPDDRGNPPSVTLIESSALTVSMDQVTVLCTVLETLDDLTDNNIIVDYVIRQSMESGPQGACVGSELGFAVVMTR